MMMMASPDMLHEKVRVLAEVFASAGRRLYLVGGCVRDRLLGRAINDLDLTTDAPPDEIKRLAARVRPDALYDIGAKFGTIGLIFRSGEVEAASDDPPEHQIEITSFRTEQYVGGSRKPVVTFGTSLEEDLARRDFTMNALAQDVLSGAVHDPYGGASDIAAQLIRAVGDPHERFQEDPLRLLRAVRFAAQLGFALEAATQAAIRAGAAALERISRERIAEELNKILSSPRAAQGIRLATELGLMQYALPEVLPMQGVSQRPLHHKDVFEHTMGVIHNIPPELGLRWAALLHDIAKPQTKSVQDGEVHFFGHEEAGERMARRILRRLHFEQRFIERVAKLVRMHLRVNSYDSEWTDAAVRRLIREVGDELDDLIALSRADVTSYRQERLRAAALRADEFERRCRELLEREDVARLQSPLNGDELMSLFGEAPGPWIKPVKEYLLGLVIDGALAQDDKEMATTLARRFVEEHALLDDR